MQLCHRLSMARIPNPKSVFWPAFHWLKSGQSKTEFLILRLLAVVIELLCRLSRALNLNPWPISSGEVSLARSWRIRDEVSYFKTFGGSDRALLWVVEGRKSEPIAHFFAEVSLVRSWPIKKRTVLFYNFSQFCRNFGRSEICVLDWVCFYQRYDNREAQERMLI